MTRHLPSVVLALGLLAVVVFGVPQGGLRSRPTTPAPVVHTPDSLGQVVEQLRSENDALRNRVEEIAGWEDRLRSQEAELAKLAKRPAVLPLHELPFPEEIDFCGVRLPLDDPQVRLRFENEWNRFLVNRHWLVSWMRRSRDAFPYVEAKLAAAGLPGDLKYVMTIESAIDPRATSSAGAVGYWQFIRGTGRRYGLDRTALMDERRDLAQATDAAIAYMSELHEEFASWPLVLASYNAGENRVRREIEEQGTRDYFQLRLPRETEAYVLKAAAVKVLFEDPERYGFHLPDDGWAPVACDTLDLRVKTTQLDFKDIALRAGLTYRQLKELNPHYRTSHLPRGTHRLVLPRTSVAGVMAAFPSAKVVARDPRGFSGDVAADGTVSPSAPPTAPPR